MNSRKWLIVLIVMVLFVSSADARIFRRGRRSLVELAPKASLYIGDDTDFGIGLEGRFNPTPNFGIRLDLTEILFEDPTAFYLNYYQSLDGLFYYPMGGMDTYFSAGFGLISAGSFDLFSIRAGLGFNHNMGGAYDLFIEPGLIYLKIGDHSDVILRISGGMKFGVLR